MAATLTVDNLDLSTLGVWVVDAPAWRDAARRSLSVVPLPGRSGGYYGTTPTLEGRDHRFVTHFRAATLAALETGSNLLRDRLLAGVVTLRLDDGVNAAKMIRGVCVDPPTFTPYGTHPMQALVHEIAFTVRCQDAHWSDVRFSSVAATAANVRVPVPLGTAASPYLLRVHGATSNPFSIILARPNGAELQRMTFALALTSSQWLDVDAFAYRVERVDASGVRTNAAGPSVWTAGEWLRLDPFDGAFALSSFPTIRTTSGSLELLYPLRWQ